MENKEIEMKTNLLKNLQEINKKYGPAFEKLAEGENKDAEEEKE